MAARTSRTMDNQHILLNFPGRELPPAEPRKLPGLIASEERVYRVGREREEGGLDGPVAVGRDQVIELTYQNGFRRWVNAEDLEQELLESGASRGSGALELPIFIDSQERGQNWILASLKLIGVDVARAAGQSLCGLVEQSAIPVPGVYRWSELQDTWNGRARVLPPVIKAIPPSDRPILMFIHGTASTTGGGFGALLSAENSSYWDALKRIYGDQIYALEHHTLTTSPIANCLSLVEALPLGCRLHVVSHSRGGLVGELLCRALRKDGQDPFSANDLALIDSELRDQLENLNRALREKRPKVDHFVRVACPAQGTTLASERLDWLLSGLAYLLKLTPLSALQSYEFLEALALAVAKERLKPSSLPGLWSMLPNSSLIKILNRTGLEVDGKLSVLSTDAQGGSLLGRLVEFGARLFYAGSANDYIVNTDSMYGGASRPGESRYFFKRIPGLHHCSYFANGPMVSAMSSALQQRYDGFRDFHDQGRLVASSGEARGIRPLPFDPAKPTVYILPGILGSRLDTSGGHRLWVNPLSIGTGEAFEELSRLPGEIRAAEWIDFFYSPLASFLQNTHNIIPFPFDWRRSILDEARRLAEHVESQLSRSHQPIRFVAHSMGGLVVRAMIAQSHLWKELRSRSGCRVLQLGTPNHGSFKVLDVLMGRDPSVQALAGFDFKYPLQAWLQSLVNMPGILQLLPATDVTGRQVHEPSYWTDLRSFAGMDDLQLPSAEALQEARRFWELLAEKPTDSLELFTYVAGKAPWTTLRYEGLRTENRVRVISTSEGDGTVPWTYGCLQPGNAYLVEAAHEHLPRYGKAFPLYLELLTTGRSLQLQPGLPAPRGEREREVEPRQLAFRPPASELEAVLMGGWPAPLEPSEESHPAISLSICHGDMGYSSYPIMKGHYAGSGLENLEVALDTRLRGRLQKWLKSGSYPGEIGTNAVVLDASTKPRGCVVVGLGTFMNLTPSQLTNSIAAATVEYCLALDAAHCLDKEKFGGISALLIGSRNRGLGLEESLRALLNGIYEGRNRALRAGVAAALQIKELEIVELYEDLALEAVRVLQDQLKQPEFQGRFLAKSGVLRLAGRPGRRKRLSRNLEQGWWSQISVTRAREGSESLSYSLITDRARSEVTELNVRKQNIQGFVASIHQY